MLHTDASAHGLGAVLEQDNRVVAYASRSLTSSERNYSVIQKECLAIIYATKQFRQYLLGRPFKLFTDHAPLQWLSAQKAEGMLARWALALQEFDFSISYKPGVQNANADALSRISSCSAVMITTKEYQVKLQEEQKSDPLFQSSIMVFKRKSDQPHPPLPSTLVTINTLQWHFMSSVFSR